jgi:putative two-component system response regulator
MKTAQHRESEKARILIVEDDTPAAIMMVHVLSRASCDALVAHTGVRGIELAQENKFDLIVLKIDLLDISGFEICSELKQRHLSRHTPIVFISGQPCEKNRQHGLDLGAVDYITKPFEAADFVTRILSHVKAGENSSLFGVIPENSTT